MHDAVPPPASGQDYVRRHSPLARVGLLCFTLLVIYASLYPFSGWTSNGIAPWAYLTAPKPRYITGFDLITNVIGYGPFGALVVLALYPRVRGVLAVLAALAAGALLSSVMEGLQTWLPTRIASNIDLATNTMGALLGGALTAPFCAALIDRGSLRRLRLAWFEPYASFAIILILLWPFAQIFPQEHLFGMGAVVREWLTDPDSWPMQVLQALVPALADWQADIGLGPDDMQNRQLLEATVTGLSWVGTGLFASVAMRRQAPMLRILIALLAGALLIKAAAAELQFPNDSAFNWLSEGGRFALLTGSLVLALLLQLPRWLRGLLALLALIALVLLTNLLPPNPYAWISEQGWRMGRFIHFNSLAQWLGWIWPFLAASYLVWRFEQFNLDRHALRRARRQARRKARAVANSAADSATDPAAGPPGGPHDAPPPAAQ